MTTDKPQTPPMPSGPVVVEELFDNHPDEPEALHAFSQRARARLQPILGNNHFVVGYDSFLTCPVILQEVSAPSSWTDIANACDDAYDGVRLTMDPSTLTGTLEYRDGTWKPDRSRELLFFADDRRRVVGGFLDFYVGGLAGPWRDLRVMSDDDVQLHWALFTHQPGVRGVAAHSRCTSLALFERNLGLNQLNQQARQVVTELAGDWEGSLESLLEAAGVIPEP